MSSVFFVLLLRDIIINFNTKIRLEACCFFYSSQFPFVFSYHFFPITKYNYTLFFWRNPVFMDCSLPISFNSETIATKSADTKTNAWIIVVKSWFNLSLLHTLIPTLWSHREEAVVWYILVFIFVIGKIVLGWRKVLFNTRSKSYAIAMSHVPCVLLSTSQRNAFTYQLRADTQTSNEIYYSSYEFSFVKFLTIENVLMKNTL